MYLVAIFFDTLTIDAGVKIAPTETLPKHAAQTERKA